jgi:hypothetical protein
MVTGFSAEPVWPAGAPHAARAAADTVPAATAVRKFLLLIMGASLLLLPLNGHKLFSENFVNAES